MPIRVLLAVALFVPGGSAWAQSEDVSSPATMDQGWKVCRDEDDPKDCADHARAVAKERLGHAESLRGYAKACLDAISKAVDEKSQKVAAAQSAVEKYEQAKQAAKAPASESSEAAEARAASESTKAQIEDAKKELARMRKLQQEASDRLEGAIAKKLDDLNYLKAKLERTSFEAESGGGETDAASTFNSGIREMVEDLQKDDAAVDKELRRIVKDQKSADPKTDCDPALKDPYY